MVEFGENHAFLRKITAQKENEFRQDFGEIGIDAQRQRKSAQNGGIASQNHKRKREVTRRAFLYGTAVPKDETSVDVEIDRRTDATRRDVRRQRRRAE